MRLSVALVFLACLGCQASMEQAYRTHNNHRDPEVTQKTMVQVMKEIYGLGRSFFRISDYQDCYDFSGLNNFFYHCRGHAIGNYEKVCYCEVDQNPYY